MKALIWMGRMSCYGDASSTGLVKLRDITKEGECIMQLNCDFDAAASMLAYNKQKNILFAASKDGNFRVWKVANEWRPKWVNRI
jgi:WD40 repeat protein